ncbi:MAG TPA: universal stress protein [Planctomycetota bacterium]|jgi:nucleotide-binding universal stress UspA family protein
MIQFKKIVLTTDFSDNSEAAVPYAVELAKRYDGEIHLLHVTVEHAYYVPMPTGEFVTMTAPEEWLKEAQQNQMKILMDRADALATHEGVKVIPMMRNGHPPTEIVHYAKEIDADCVVISTHGRTGLAHLLHGSVGESVLRHCPKPVLSVRPPKLQK